MVSAAAKVLNLTVTQLRLRLADFDLEVSIETDCRVTGLFGPSGAGKTSLLDAIAGLRRATGVVRLGDRVLSDSGAGIFVPARQRRIGYVPQDLALFPHLSVRQNLAYGVKASGNSDALFSFEHVTGVLEIAQLTARRVTELSGGEKQRVALARALLSSPILLLLDEPLASVDEPLKARITSYLTRIRDEFPVSMIYVTHDRDEAIAIADEIVVLNRGKVLGAGTPQEVFGV